MSKTCRTIVGIHVTERTRHAGEIQKVLTQFGCNIKTRLGLHEASEGVCSPNGLILLECVCGGAECSSMIAQLKAIEGLDVQKMVFENA
ncbi:MAG TPA: hypothetical protein PLP01_00980 [Phycisphaerae bacterium]|nr:hypothetical protein [Phycisphaerae bacterium]HOI53799.1 hypothetical protein [Phycisphaerae bacterium]